MQNKSLATDYIHRSQIRLKALKTLLDEEGWADVVREAQEIVELSLKAVLRNQNILPPRIHDVSPVIEENMDKFPKEHHKLLKTFVEYSRSLRRDRELAFYGSEDLTPSDFYKKADALEAFKMAQEIVEAAAKWATSQE